MEIKDIAALIIGHGSRLEAQKKIIERFAESIRNKKVFGDVFYAFVSENRPSIKEALAHIVAKGYRKLVAIPVFLSEGIHTTEGIPKELGLENGQRRRIVEINGIRVEVWYARTMGYDERIVEILVERGKEAIENF